MGPYGKPSFSRKNCEDFLNLFFSNMCLVILSFLSVLKISVGSDLPSSRLRNARERGGVPLKIEFYLYMIILILLMDRLLKMYRKNNLQALNRENPDGTKND
jgi:hypothetical protein